MEFQSAPTKTEDASETKEAVTVNVWVHDDFCLDQMPHIGIHATYYCKYCGEYSRHLPDIAQHTAVCPNRVAGAEELTEDEAAIESLVLTRGSATAGAANVSHSEVAQTDGTSEHNSSTIPMECQMPEEEVDEIEYPLEEIPSATRAMKRMQNLDQSSYINTVPRKWFCVLCPYTFFYSDNDYKLHDKCHKAGAIPTLNCFLCKDMENCDPSWSKLKSHLWFAHKLDFEIRCRYCLTEFKNHVEHGRHVAAEHALKCNVANCRTVMYTEEDLRTHSACHADGGFRCFVCGYMYQNEPGKWSKMHDHLVDKHPDKIDPLYNCHLCGKGFQTIRKHLLHMKQCEGFARSRCTICNRNLPDASLDKHYNKHFLESDRQKNEKKRIKANNAATVNSGWSALYECNQHNLAFETWEHFEQHFKTDHSSDQYVITVNTRGPDEGDVVTEVVTPGGERHEEMMVVLDTGEVVAQQQEDPNTSHMIIEFEDSMNRTKKGRPKVENKAKCMYCYKMFNALTLKNHIAKAHSDEINGVGYACPHCNKEFKNKIRLRNHVRCTHEGEKTIVEDELGRVTVVHTRANLKICDQCGYSTPSPARLQRHKLAVHEGIMPFECKNCGYKTAEQSDLRRHVERHVGLKKHECKFCSYRSAHRWLLVNHCEKQHNVLLPKNHRDTMGTPWSTRWRQKMEREKETAVAMMLQYQMRRPEAKQGTEEVVIDNVTEMAAHDLDSQKYETVELDEEQMRLLQEGDGNKVLYVTSDGATVTSVSAEEQAAAEGGEDKQVLYVSSSGVTSERGDDESGLMQLAVAPDYVDKKNEKG